MWTYVYPKVAKMYSDICIIFVCFLALQKFVVISKFLIENYHALQLGDQGMASHLDDNHRKPLDGGWDPWAQQF